MLQLVSERVLPISAHFGLTTLEFKYVFYQLQVTSEDPYIRWDGLSLLEGEDEDPPPSH
jgi:hypothetical protein